LTGKVTCAVCGRLIDKNATCKMYSVAAQLVVDCCPYPATCSQKLNAKYRHIQAACSKK